MRLQGFDVVAADVTYEIRPDASDQASLSFSVSVAHAEVGQLDVEGEGARQGLTLSFAAPLPEPLKIFIAFLLWDLQYPAW
jgi:hypothetical protein